MAERDGQAGGGLDAEALAAAGLDPDEIAALTDPAVLGLARKVLADPGLVAAIRAALTAPGG